MRSEISVGIVKSSTKPISFKRRMLPLLESFDNPINIKVVDSLSDLENFDYIIFQSVPKIEWARKLLCNDNQVLVYDNSDYLGSIFGESRFNLLVRLIRWTLLSLAKFRTHEYILLFRLLKKSKLVVTGSILQKNFVIDRFDKISENIVDPVNSIEYSGKKSNQIERKDIKILWEGTGASFLQLHTVIDALEIVSQLYEFELVILTDISDSNGYQSLSKLLRSKFKVRIIQWSVVEFQRNILECSFAIAPIDIKDKFNIAKPYNKALSYGAYGVPVIATSIPSYEELANRKLILTSNNTIEWVNYLSEFCASQNKRVEYADRLYDYVWSKHSSKVFKETYLRVLSKARLKAS